MVSKSLLVLLIVALFVVAFAADNKKDAKAPEKKIAQPAVAAKHIGKAKKEEYYGQENEENYEDNDGYGHQEEQQDDNGYGHQEEQHDDDGYGHQEEQHDNNGYGHQEEQDNNGYGHHNEKPEHHTEKPEHHTEKPEHHNEKPEHHYNNDNEYGNHDEKPEHHEGYGHNKLYDESKFQKVKICTYAEQDTTCLYPVACQQVFGAQCFNLPDGESAMIFTGSTGATFYNYAKQDCGATGAATTIQTINMNQCATLKFGSSNIITQVFTLYSVSK
jgi:hypothetical protein